MAEPSHITKVMPPDQPHPSGTLLFAIFPREGHGWDFDTMTATAWEFAPDRAEQPQVKRCVFLKSHWAASPLTGRGLEPLGPDLVRLQVSDGPSPYSVRLYHIDYASWTVRTLFAGKQAIGIGRSGDHAYLRTSEGPMVLDVPSGKLAESDVTGILIAKEDRWVVELGNGAALFDPKAGKVLRALKDFPRTDRQVPTDPTGRHAVIRQSFSTPDGDPVFVLPFGEPRVIQQAITLYDLERGTRRDLTARLVGTGGSGVGVIPSGPDIAFTPGQLRFTSVLAGVNPEAFRPGKDEEWVVVDLETQKEVSRQPYAEWKAPEDPGVVPDYLQELAKELSGAVSGRHHDLALAALVHHQVVDPDEARESRNIPPHFRFVVLSPEGDRLLALRDATLHYCDLKERTHRAVPVPPELEGASVRDACAVRIP